MSLLPKSRQISDAIPMTLGALVRETIAPKPDPIAEFNGHRWVNDTVVRDGVFHFVYEKDCKQIKGAAQRCSRPVAEREASAPVAAPPLSVPEAATEKPKLKVGDRVQWLHITGTITDIRPDDGFMTLKPDDGGGDLGWKGTEDKSDIELLPPIAPTPASSEWIEWGGLGVPDLTNARTLWVRFRDGDELECSIGDSTYGSWAHKWGGGDIVAYRVVNQP